MSKGNTNSIHNDNIYDQDDLNDSEFMKIGEIKQSDTIRKFKYDNVYMHWILWVITPKTNF